MKSYHGTLCLSDCDKTYGIFLTLCNDVEKKIISKIHTYRITGMLKDTMFLKSNAFGYPSYI